MHAYSDGAPPPNLLRADFRELFLSYDLLPARPEAASEVLHYGRTADWAAYTLSPWGLVPLVRFVSLVSRS